jgi:membrane protease YdiL (CAAX protease family)
MPESEHYPINQPKFSLASNLWIFPLLLILVIAVAIVIDPIAALIPMPEQIKALFRESFGKNVNIIDLVISTTILAPIMEETLCRGIILRGISRYNGALSAVVWSAFIFALIHLNPWQAIPAFILGLIFGWVYIKTRSIWLVVFMHFVNNGFFVVLTRSLPNIDVDSIIADFMPMWLYLVLWAVSIVTTAVILIFLNKKINSYEQETLSSKISTSC